MRKFIAGITLALVAALAIVPQANAAFSATALVRLARDGNTGPNLYSYATSDAIATVEGSNYFQSGNLRAGDLIWVKASDAKKLKSVTAATSTTSTIADVSGTQPVWICTDGSGYGTAGAVAYTVAPIAGTVTKAYHTVTTATDADVALNLDGAGTNMTGTITVTNADGAGTIDSATISANNTVTAGEAIKVESDGAGTTGAGQTCFQITP